MRVLGLPMHLWGKEFFKRLGDACGGYVTMDVKTEERCHLKWARLLIKSNGRNSSCWFLVVDRKDVFAIIVVRSSTIVVEGDF